MSTQDEINSLCSELGFTMETMLEMVTTHGSDPEALLAELKRRKLDDLLAKRNALQREIEGMQA